MAVKALGQSKTCADPRLGKAEEVQAEAKCPAENQGPIHRIECVDYSLKLRRINGIFSANDAENKERNLYPRAARMAEVSMGFRAHLPTSG